MFLCASVFAAVAFAEPALAQTEEDGVGRSEGTQAIGSDASLSYVRTESPPEKRKIWRFTLAPYVMFPFINGSVTLVDQTVDVNLNTGDILKRLNWFLKLYFEARHPKFTIATDVLYVNLGQGKQLPGIGRSFDLRMQQLATEIVVLGRIADWFELGAGGRVNFVQAGIRSPAGAILPAVDLDSRRTWFDPLIAVRFSVPFKNDHWRLALRADFGGFTVGSKYAWQVYPYGGYNFDGINGKRVFELGVAFRAFGMKYETGSGRERFVYDTILWGPLLGFVFHF